jgi:pilus assembly protein CpaC
VSAKVLIGCIRDESHLNQRSEIMRRKIATGVGLLGLIGAAWFGAGKHVIGYEPPTTPPAFSAVVPAESNFQQLGQRLQPVLKKCFPKCDVELIGLSDKIIIKGSAATAQEAAAIVSAVQTVVEFSLPTGGQQAATLIRGDLVVNLLEIPGEAQVTLRVKIIEADRRVVNQALSGSSKTEQPASKSEPQNRAAPADGTRTQTGLYPRQVVEFAAAELLKDRSAKQMCAPTVTVLSGHAASFLSGGEFTVPMIVGVAGGDVRAVGIRAVGNPGKPSCFRGFGTSLQVTPTVIGTKDHSKHLHLELLCESSRLDETNLVAGIPGITGRRIQTQILMKADQTVVMVLPTLSAIESTSHPLAGTLPVIGAARAADRKPEEPATREKCLFITVTPELLKPMTPDDVPTPSFEIVPPPHANATWLPNNTLLTTAGTSPALCPPLPEPAPFERDSPFGGPLPAGRFFPITPPANSSIQPMGGWNLTLPATGRSPPIAALPAPSRLEHLKSALTHLEAAALTDQVTAIQKEIELEQQSEARHELAQRERELEALQRQIETLRRSLSPQQELNP